MHRIERRQPKPTGKVCAFTGHRPNKYPFLSNPQSADYRRLEAKLNALIDRALQEGFTHFITGGALGCDTMAALCVLKKRQSVPEITLEIAIPCPEQYKFWSAADRALYEQILDSADILTTISPQYTPFCMHERNRRMVDMCDLLIAVYDGTKGGTHMTLSYALDEGKRIEIINPTEISEAT